MRVSSVLFGEDCSPGCRLRAAAFGSTCCSQWCPALLGGVFGARFCLVASLRLVADAPRGLTSKSKFLFPPSNAFGLTGFLKTLFRYPPPGAKDFSPSRRTSGCQWFDPTRESFLSSLLAHARVARAALLVEHQTVIYGFFFVFFVYFPSRTTLKEFG